MNYESLESDLDFLALEGVISTSDKNLRSKIGSLLRSIENLEAKRERLTYEINKQKKSLTRKRQELKRVSRSNQKNSSLALESAGEDFLLFDQGTLNSLRRLDSILLEISSRKLEA